VRFDSHTHAWNAWPYVDPFNPSSGEALLGVMDAYSVDRSLIVCANIDESRENNMYVAEFARRHEPRLSYVVDADSMWSRQHHLPGAVSRLEGLVESFPDAAGITHYVQGGNVDAWFQSRDGRAWLDVVARSYGLLSLAASPAWASVVHEIAREHGDLTILWHHLAGLQVSHRGLLHDVTAVAEAPNVLLKLSGFHYLSERADQPPWVDVWPVLDDLCSAFGAARLCWGSDFPASLRYTDYETSVAAVEEWLRRLESFEREAILGRNLDAIVRPRGVGHA
jgi:predicted TIM-barrel fold metal-dependent hydrolase